ncbi:MAG: hypothetical protein RL477_1847 [Pseudomonadota bacterium]
MSGASFVPVIVTATSCVAVEPLPSSTVTVVHDALPEATQKRLEGLVAEHSYWYSRKLGGGPEPTPEERDSRPPARHPVIYVCPRTGRKSLYIASHVSAIVGWPEDETRALIDELMAFATRPQFVYSHVWRPGDVVVWDNLTTLHRATPFDDQRYRRDMRRATCRETPVHSVPA